MIHWNHPALTHIETDPFTNQIEDFLADGDVSFCVVLGKIHLWAQLYEQKIRDPNEVLNAIFDDDDEENWSCVEQRWVDIFTKSSREVQQILKRYGEMLTPAVPVNPDTEAEWQELWIRLNDVVIECRNKINADIQNIIQRLKEMKVPTV